MLHGCVTSEPYCGGMCVSPYGADRMPVYVCVCLCVYAWAVIMGIKGHADKLNACSCTHKPNHWVCIAKMIAWLFWSNFVMINFPEMPVMCPRRRTMSYGVGKMRYEASPLILTATMSFHCNMGQCTAQRGNKVCSMTIVVWPIQYNNNIKDKLQWYKCKHRHILLLSDFHMPLLLAARLCSAHLTESYKDGRMTPWLAASFHCHLHTSYLYAQVMSHCQYVKA